MDATSIQGCKPAGLQGASRGEPLGKFLAGRWGLRQRRGETQLARRSSAGRECLASGRVGCRGETGCGLDAVVPGQPADSGQRAAAFDSFVAQLGALAETETHHGDTDLASLAKAVTGIPRHGEEFEVVWSEICGNGQSQSWSSRVA